MQEDSIFTKEKSKVVHGVAICLMVFHHLFAFPERIDSPYKLIFDFSVLHLETMLAYFGKICVSMFAFVSGYGMTKKRMQIEKGYKLSMMQLKKFYMCYWNAFIVFVPYGMYKGILKVQAKEILENLIGFSCSYNAEWWYVKEYVIMLLVFPSIYSILKYIAGKCKIKWKVLIEIVLVSLIAIVNSNTKYIVIFIVGMIFAGEEVFEFFYRRMKGNYWSLFLMCMVMGIRTLFGQNVDIFITPIFVYAIYIFSEENSISKYIIVLLKNIGRYSVYIWLIHTFFVYYYFQNIVFIPQYSVLIFIWTMFLCICIAWCLGKIQSIFTRKRTNSLIIR